MSSSCNIHALYRTCLDKRFRKIYSFYSNPSLVADDPAGPSPNSKNTLRSLARKRKSPARLRAASYGAKVMPRFLIKPVIGMDGVSGSVGVGVASLCVVFFSSAQPCIKTRVRKNLKQNALRRFKTFARIMQSLNSEKSHFFCKASTFSVNASMACCCFFMISSK